MAVYDRSYAPWSGACQSRFRRIGAMVRMGLAEPFRSPWVLLVLSLAFMLVAGWLLILFIILSSNIPPQMKNAWAMGNNVYREGFYNHIVYLATLAVLATSVGGPLISRDLQHGALLMYFSRAISRVDYVVAKFLTLVLFLLTAALPPGLLLLLGQAGLSSEGMENGEFFADLGAIVLHSLVLTVPLSAAALAFSSATRRPHLAGGLWAILFFSSWQIGEILHKELQQEWCLLLSWPALTARLGNAFYETRSVKGGFLLPPAASTGGWEEPLLILAGITALSLGFVAWRVARREPGR